MNHLYAVLIFTALSAAAWWVAVLAYRATLGTPDPAAADNYWSVAVTAVAAAGMGCMTKPPGNTVVPIIAWAVATFLALGLPFSRAAVLFLYLVLASAVLRLAVVGALEVL